MKYNNLIIDYGFMPLSGFLVVKYLTSLNFDFTYKLYENNFIIIDYWFLIHILNTNLIIIFYPYKLSNYKFWYIVFGWEFIENILIPNNFKKFDYFKEDIRDTFGDIVAALPASYFLYLKNTLKLDKKN